ncbi:MAG: hypothetical protein ABSD67_12695 [Terracidiphilus sp.]|jgi:hypothetical protein
MRHSQLNKPDRDPDRAKVIALLNGLLGLTGDQNAIIVSVARLRKAAQRYSDHELKRFAQLIILCDHPPGEWRERLLTEVTEREDALKEIAMSIDHSWIPTEAEDDAALEDLRNQIIRNYPNPHRINCPNESDLRRVVLGDINEYPDSGVLIEHTLTCGPCTRQLGILVKEKTRLRSTA